MSSTQTRNIGSELKNLWNEKDAAACGEDALALRVYSSRLIGQASDLVLHGGGNTSVKAEFSDIFDDRHEVLYVKGSGWDLATIEAPGFAPVALDALLKLSRFDVLSDARHGACPAGCHARPWRSQSVC